VNQALLLSPARRLPAKVRARRIAQANRLPRRETPESAPYLDRVFQERQETEERSFVEAVGIRRAKAILGKKQSDDRAARRRGRFLLELVVASSPRHAELLSRRFALTSAVRPVRRQTKPQRATLAQRPRRSSPPSGPDDGGGDAAGGAGSTPAGSRSCQARGHGRRGDATTGQEVRRAGA